MSEVVRHYGKVRKADLNGMDKEQWCEAKCKELGIEKESWNNSYEDALLHEPYPVKFVKVNNEFWEVVENRKEKDYDDISMLFPAEDGTYNFLFQFYNGGASFGEMLENALLNQKKE